MNTFSPMKSSVEGQFTMEQIKGYLKILPIIAGGLCLFSAFLLFYGIYFSIKISHEIFIFHAVISGLGIILAILGIVWGAKAKSMLSKDKISSGGLGMLIYQLGLFVIVFWIFCCICILVVNQIATTTISKSEVSKEFKANHDQLKFSLIFLLIATFLAFCCAGYIVYIVFMCSNASQNHKNTFNFWALVLIVFASLGIYAYKYSMNQAKLRNTQKNLNPRVMEFGLVACILSGIVVLIGYALNLFRFRRPYLFFAGAFIWIVVIALLAAGFNFRHAKTLYSSNLKECPQILHWATKDDIKAMGCEKYETITLNDKKYPSLNCQPRSLGENWEEEESKEIANKSRKFSCVEEKCCSTVIPKYTNSFFRFAVCLLGVFIASFMVFSATVILAEKADVTQKSGAKDYLIGALIALAILVILLIAFYSTYKPPKEKPLVIAAETEISKNNHQIHINPQPQKLKDYPAKYCELFSKIYPSYSEVNSDLNSPKTKVYRLVIKGMKGKFRLPRDFNSDKIFRFPSEKYKKKFFPEIKEGDSFFAFQGEIKYVKEFLEKDLKFCYSPDKTYSFKVYRYFKPDSTTKFLEEGERVEEVRSPDKGKYEGVQDSISFDETPVNSNWEKLYKTQFTNLVVRSVNILGFTPIKNVNVRLYKGLKPCVETKEEPMSVLKSDSKGIAKFLNLAPQHYTVFVDLKGFKSNCLNIKTFNNREEYSTDLSMLPDFKDKYMVVLLSYNQENAELLLRSTFNYDKKIICSVNPSNKNCGGMLFKERLDSQLAVFDKIGFYHYLFYVQRIPKKEGEKKILSRVLGGEDVKLSTSNTELAESDAVVKVYVDNLIYPVQVTVLPSITEEQNKDPNQIWLIGCMNGKVGPASIKEINKIWSKPAASTSAKYWNKVGKAHLPNSNICESLYSNGNN